MGEDEQARTWPLSRNSSPPLLLFLYRILIRRHPARLPERLRAVLSTGQQAGS